MFNHVYNTIVILVSQNENKNFSKRHNSPSSPSMFAWKLYEQYIYLFHRTLSPETRCERGRVVKLLPYYSPLIYLVFRLSRAMKKGWLCVQTHNNLMFEKFAFLNPMSGRREGSTMSWYVKLKTLFFYVSLQTFWVYVVNFICHGCYFASLWGIW